MNDLLLNPQGKRREWHDFENHIRKLGIQYDQHYLNTEYNLAVATGQNAANYMRQLAGKDNIPYVQYRTMCGG